MSTSTSTSESSLVQEIIKGFFKSNSIWSLLKFLQYRKTRDGFLSNNLEEHRNYKKALEILSVHEDYAEKARNCLATFESEKTSLVVDEFWRMADRKRHHDEIELEELEYTKRALKETNNETHFIRAITTNKMMRRLRRGSGDQAEESGSQDPEESDDDFQPVTARQKPKKQLSLSKKNKESVVVASKKIKPTSRNDRAEGSTSSDLSRSHLKATPSSLVSRSQSSEMPIGTESAGPSEVSSPEHNRPHTPPHQIVRNTSDQETSINENILIISAKNLASLDESKYLGEFIPLFVKYKESEKNNAFSYANDDVMDIRGESGFAKFLSIDQYIKLLSKKPSRKVKLPEDWCNIIEEYYKGTTENGSKKSVSDWILSTKELNIVKKDDTEETIKLKDYLNRVMLPLIESFAKPIPDVNASGVSEHHYWAEFGHRFFSRALQEFVNLDWWVMEAPALASKYRKNYGHNHAIDKVVDGNSADLLARIWGTGEEIFVGEQAGPPNKPDLTKFATDSFKLYREMRDCLNVRILRAMRKGDVNYNNRMVFGIFGYLYEIKMLIMWKDGVYVYEEFGSLNIATIPDQIPIMKMDMLKLLEFMIIIKTEVENTETSEYNSDMIQILKRKFNELVQTKTSPTKVPKVQTKASSDKTHYTPD